MTLKPQPNRRALTLVETITVMAVLGILAAILIISVSRVRAAGNAAACASNLRALGTAYLLLTTDRGGYFPSSRQQNAYDPATGGIRIAQGGFMQDMLSDYIANPIVLLREPGAKPEDAGLYWCPGRDRNRTSLTVPDGQHPIYSYSHNTALGSNRALPTMSWLGPEAGDPNPDYHPGLAMITAVTEPGLIIVFTEQTFPGRVSSGSLTANIWPLLGSSGPTPPNDRQLDFTRHNGYINAFFLDGSLQRKNFEDLVGTGGKHLIPRMP